MRRLLFGFFFFFLALLLVAGGFTFWALNNEPFLKNQLVELVREQTGRELVIDGPVDIRPGRETAVTASGIALENAPWGDDDAMLRIGRIQAVVDVFSLLRDRVRIPRLYIEDCIVEFRENLNGVSNWDILPPTDSSEDEEGKGVLLLDLGIDRCTLTADGPRFEQPLELAIMRARLEPSPGDAVEGVVEGRLNQDELSAQGWLGPIDALVNGGELRHELTLRSGEVVLESSGTVADAATWAGPDIETRFSGPDIALLLERFALPAFSEGAFDFRAHIRNQGELSAIDIDGDLGKLRLQASGEVDRLVAPTRGAFNAAASGPDLQALGAAFGMDTLVAAAFEARLALQFEGPAIEVDSFELSTDQDHLAVSGSIARDPARQVSALDITFRSDGIDRWIAPYAMLGGTVGAASMEGRVSAEPGGALGIDASARALQTEITARGTLGSLGGPLEPVLEVGISSKDPAVAGAAFGIDGLPGEPLSLTGSFAAESGGIRFQVSDGSMGEVRLKANGRIPDLDKPLGMDLDFDMALPELSVFQRWLPDRTFPAGGLTATGRLENNEDRVHLRDVVVIAVGSEARLAGSFSLEETPSFDLDLGFASTDLSLWQELAGTQLPVMAVDFSANVSGQPNALEIRGIRLDAGESRVEGNIDITEQGTVFIAGSLASPRLELNPWLAGEEPAPGPEPDAGPLLFDETELQELGVLGVELNLELSVALASFRNAEYSDVNIHLLLRDHQLEIAPFNLSGSGGGHFSGAILFDESGPVPVLDVDLAASTMPLAIGAREGQDPSTLPRADLRFSLHGTGRTHRQLAESLDGKVRLEVGPGQLAASNYTFLTNDFIAELLGILNPFSKTREFTQIECAVAAAEIESGQVALDPIVLQTEQLTVVSQGAIDLGTEKIDLTFNSKQRKGLGFSASDLVNPFIKVGGTLASPVIELDPAGTVVRGGLAVVTGGLSILANSLAERFLSSNDPCGKALEQIEKRDRESSSTR